MVEIIKVIGLFFPRNCLIYCIISASTCRVFHSLILQNVSYFMYVVFITFNLIRITYFSFCTRYELLTLKWPTYFPPVGAQGGSMEPRLRKPLSWQNFVIYTSLYVYTLKPSIFKQKKIQKKKNISKWWPNDRFLFRVISISAKI